MADCSEFVIEDYNNAKAFASFLPSIAGLWGKPLWVYYANRGQAISNFGVRDKDGAMLEFTAANKAWRQTALQGFRTFYKINGKYYEPFRNSPYLQNRKIRQTMHIRAHSVMLRERSEESGIETEAEFFTLPNEAFPALLRRLSIRNISSQPQELECIDGLAMLIPWGTRNWMLKNMSRLGEGWFAGVHYSAGGTPYYKLPVEALDRPEIVPLDGAHFYCGGVRADGGNGARSRANAPLYCIDPETVFGPQMDFDFPAVFIRNDVFTIDPGICGKNKTPCAMGYFSCSLAPGACAVYDSMTAHCTDISDIDASAAIFAHDGFFEQKEKENRELIAGIISCAHTESADARFDAYCSQNFLDNALRGGFPVDIGENTPYYAYSRVHGDMEREYNNFDILSEYFSQGNGNYRDVNQNRRCDIFFNRNINDDSIHFFTNLIQIDGFNPLKVLGVRFIFESDENRKHFLDDLGAYTRQPDANTNSGFTEKLTALLSSCLTIGNLFNCLETYRIVIKDRDALLASFLKYTKRICLAEHGEGYWSDHWHYNTDLIEYYLAVFPDRLEQLLCGRTDYTWYDDCYFVEPRSVKYVLRSGLPRQIRGVNRDPEKEALIASRTENQNTVRSGYGRGPVYYTNLLGKLLCVIANKYASLDPEGLGIEMESDKPNWCDALNGLPGLFGSSCAESLELLRLVSFLNRSLVDIPQEGKFPLAAEVSGFIADLTRLSTEVSGDFEFWDKTHTVKENFREKTRLGISGDEISLTIKNVRVWLDIFEQKLMSCRAKLEAISQNGVIPTSFEFIPVSYRVDTEALQKLPESARQRQRDGVILDSHAGSTEAMMAIAGEKNQHIVVESFKRKDFPLFLEGPVHYLRLCPEKNIAENFHRHMLESPLYDKKLDMIKVNAPLAGAGRDIGRITVFTSGWLENESVWLHMEYKYLLELLRNGMAKEFFGIAKTALVPFFNPAVYGRSIYENSSFIVSSAH
ncbi:MAG: hypothetical protein FWF29_08045, partial [Treponema sp.]|nr:hypothetical protein [Treponema sp.]